MDGTGPVTQGPGPALGPGPFAEVGRLLIDGNNLLHRLSGTAAPGAVRLLVARLNATIPRTVETLVVLDGPPDPGGPMHERIRAGLELRHAGRIDADGAIVRMVQEQPYAARPRTVVVTDDRALVERVRRAGGRTERLHWLESLLDGRSPTQGRQRGSSVARSRPLPTGRAPAPAPGPSGNGSEPEDRAPWKPGRGATRKRGNPHRGSTPQR